MPEITGPLFYESQPEYAVTLNGIDYAWVAENTIYRRAEQQILEYISARADPQQDLIVVDVNAAFARHYNGPVPLELLLTPPTREDAVQVRLQELSRGRRSFWHLVYPDATEGRTALVAQHLMAQCTIGDEIVVDGVRAIRYDLPAEPRFVPLEMPNPSGVRFGEHIVLLGFDADTMTLMPGEPLRVRFLWQADGPVGARYTVFTHLLRVNGDNTKFGQLDCQPVDGLRPTDTWQVGERIIDDHILDVLPNAPPGDYMLLVGMYEAETLTPVPVYDPTGRPLTGRVLQLIGFAVSPGQEP